MIPVYLKVEGQTKAYRAEIESNALDDIKSDWIAFNRIRRDGGIETFFVPRNKVEYIQLNASGDHGENGERKDALDVNTG